MTLAWGDLNKQTYLISAHPGEYAAASVELLALPMSALGAMVAPGRKQWRRTLRAKRELPALRRRLHRVAAGNPTLIDEMRARGILSEEALAEPPEPEDTPTGLPVVDLVLAFVFSSMFLLATIAWLLLIVPVQYFVYLVTGAPAREACASPVRALYLREGKISVFAQTRKSETIPEGAVESGFSAQPVSFTAAITAAALFAASNLVS